MAERGGKGRQCDDVAELGGWSWPSGEDWMMWQREVVEELAGGRERGKDWYKRH